MIGCCNNAAWKYLTKAGVFAQLRYSGPADTLWRLTRIELFDLSGPVALSADVTGTVASPQIRGLVRASNARIQSATTGTVVTNIQTAGRFDGSRLRIERFTGDAGRGGRVTGTGTFDFAAANGVAFDLRIDADHAVLIDREDIGATATGPLAFTSDGVGGVISGDVRLDSSRYRLGQATVASAIRQTAMAPCSASSACWYPVSGSPRGTEYCRVGVVISVCPVSSPGRGDHSGRSRLLSPLLRRD